MVACTQSCKYDGRMDDQGLQRPDWALLAGRMRVSSHEKKPKQCQYCRATITMIRNDKGNWIPAQRVTQVWGRSGPMFNLSQIKDLGGELYVSHWQTCPDAAKVRADMDAKKKGEST